MLPYILPMSRHRQILQAVLQQVQAHGSKAPISSCWLGDRRWSSSESHDKGQGASVAAHNAADAPVDLQQLRDIPGYLKGPVGRRVVRALGEDEWQPAKDPRTGEPCWRSNKTGEYTVPGIDKPDTWTQIADKKTGLLYYWNMRTGETTDIGEPKPGPYGRTVARSEDSARHLQQPQTGLFSEFFGSSSSAEVRREDTARTRNDDGRKPFTVINGLKDLLTQPTGWAFLGFSLLAFMLPYVQGWISTTQ